MSRHETASYKTHERVTRGGSAVSRYMDVMIGERSTTAFIYFEWCLLLSIVPGALGLLLRKLFWPKLFGRCGKNVVFGTNITLRQPKKASIGDEVVIGEGTVIDSRGKGEEVCLSIGERTMIGNQSIISVKEGRIEIGTDVSIGPQSIIQSTHGCPVVIERDVMIGPKSYLVGGGNYHSERTDIPIRKQGIKPDSGVCIGEDVWLGANVVIIGGVEVGKKSICAAGAVVNRSVEPLSVCAGVPARIIKTRTDDQTSFTAVS